jgi:transcriptional regulator with XRE-family HTH domain
MNKQQALERLGRAVRRCREARRLSQAEVAKRTGLHRTFVGRVERGVTNPSFSHLQQLAAGVGVPLSVIVAEAEREGA